MIRLSEKIGQLIRAVAICPPPTQPSTVCVQLLSRRLHIVTNLKKYPSKTFIHNHPKLYLMEKPRFKLSPSSINVMLDCPRCFWLQLTKKIRRPSGPFPSLPNGMDRILKEHFDRFMEKGLLPPELSSHECIGGCSLFNDKEKLKVWRSNFKGIEYFDKASGVLLRGAVDNLLIKGKTLTVLDYKTRGFPLKEDTHEHYRLQMDIYNFLLRKNGYKTSDKSYLLFYYPNSVNAGGEVIFETRLVPLKVNTENGEKMFRKAVKLLDSDTPPEPSKECQFCEWARRMTSITSE